MTRLWTIALVVALGCQGTMHRQPRHQKVELLLRQQLDAAIAADREIILQRAWVPPNSTVTPHWHPSETFHYYLQGEAQIRLQNGETLDRRAGQVSHIPLQSTHSVLAGPNGVTILIFRVHVRGEPVRYDGERDSSHD